MNIFVLDKNPKIAAQYHCDKHVIKMILETSQLLCSVFYYRSNLLPPYKLTHKNHPCVKWVRESKSNFDWTCLLLFFLIKEYKSRYNQKQHQCEKILNWVMRNKEELHWDNFSFTKFPIVMPIEYKIGNNPIESYRNYYKKEKIRFANYKYTKKPFWLENEKENKWKKYDTEYEEYIV